MYQIKYGVIFVIDFARDVRKNATNLAKSAVYSALNSAAEQVFHILKIYYIHFQTLSGECSHKSLGVGLCFIRSNPCTYTDCNFGKGQSTSVTVPLNLLCSNRKLFCQ